MPHLIETLRETSFFGGETSGPTAAQYSHVQFFNPLASAVDCFLKKLIVTVGGASGIWIRRHDSPITTLGTWKGNKKIDAVTTPKLEIRHATNVAVLGTGLATLQPVQTTDKVELGFDDPLHLAPNIGIAFACSVVNIQLGVFAEWIEKPIT